jgi:hypothetical protein
MSKRRSRRSSPNRKAVRRRADSVLPTPVGPSSRNEPSGLRGIGEVGLQGDHQLREPQGRVSWPRTRAGSGRARPRGSRGRRASTRARGYRCGRRRPPGPPPRPARLVRPRERARPGAAARSRDTAAPGRQPSSKALGQIQGAIQGRVGEAHPARPPTAAPPGPAPGGRRQAQRGQHQWAQGLDERRVRALGAGDVLGGGLEDQGDVAGLDGGQQEADQIEASSPRLRA